MQVLDLLQVKECSFYSLQIPRITCEHVFIDSLYFGLEFFHAIVDHLNTVSLTNKQELPLRSDHTHALNVIQNILFLLWRCIEYGIGVFVRMDWGASFTVYYSVYLWLCDGFDVLVFNYSLYLFVEWLGEAFEITFHLLSNQCLFRYLFSYSSYKQLYILLNLSFNLNLKSICIINLTKLNQWKIKY